MKKFIQTPKKAQKHIGNTSQYQKGIQTPKKRSFANPNV